MRGALRAAYTLCSAKYYFTMQSMRGARARARFQRRALRQESGSAALQVEQASRASVIGLGRRARIEQHLLEHREIAEEALASVGRDADERQRPGVLRGPRDLDELRGLEHFQVPAQVAVRQPAELPERGERQALRIREERREHPEARALVHHSIEALVRKRMRALALRFGFLHSPVCIRTAERRRPRG